MKFLRVFAGLIVLYFLLFGGVSSMSGCKKTETIHDTTINNIHDSTFIKDSIGDLINGLVAYYNFNGGSLKDSSNFGNEIIFSNAVKAPDRFGNPDNAYAFNGVNNYMRVANDGSLNPDNISFFVIVKVNGFSGANCHINNILGKGTPDDINGYYSMRVQDSFPCGPLVDSTHEFFYGSFGDNIPQGATTGASTDTIPLQKGQWYTITFTYDGQTAKIYRETTLISSQQKPGINLTDNANDLFIGRHESDVFPYWFNGVIDEIRIYNRALPIQTIRLLNNLNN